MGLGLGMGMGRTLGHHMCHLRRGIANVDLAHLVRVRVRVRVRVERSTGQVGASQAGG